MVNWGIAFLIGGGVLFGSLFCCFCICLCYHLRKDGHSQNGGRGYTGGGVTGGIGGDFSGGGGDGGGGGGGDGGGGP